MDLMYHYLDVVPIAGGLIAAGVHKVLHTKGEREKEQLPPK